MLFVTAAGTLLLSKAEPFSQFYLYSAYFPALPYCAHMKICIYGVWA